MTISRKLTPQWKVCKIQYWDLSVSFKQSLVSSFKYCNAHWVCVSSVGVNNGIINLYDSLYHNVIQNEVDQQVINLVGQNNYCGLHVVPVQQQRNGCDCGVFAAAFATCLINGIPPQTVQFDITQMRPHLIMKCLQMGEMELFPTF